MGELLLDTNVLVLHLRKRGSVTEFLLKWGQQDNLHISVVTRTELIAGMRPREERTTMDLLASLHNLPITPAIADRAGRLIYAKARQGIQVSFPDALIAATALEHELIVVTTNARHFEEVGARAQELRANC
ncbi:MAG: type II toxin-antitoxin system VapC family toxin [Chloroflexi bacterium]|nr:type II toxin-antitoxin system VapC family toxin [Chloroflexota bacterium]